jgi:hypothetical protein
VNFNSIALPCLTEVVLEKNYNPTVVQGVVNGFGK